MVKIREWKLVPYNWKFLITRFLISGLYCKSTYDSSSFYRYDKTGSFLFQVFFFMYWICDFLPRLCVLGPKCQPKINTPCGSDIFMYLTVKMQLLFWYHPQMAHKNNKFLKLVYLRSIAKQVIPSYINNSWRLILDGIQLMFWMQLQSREKPDLSLYAEP